MPMLIPAFQLADIPFALIVYKCCARKSKCVHHIMTDLCIIMSMFVVCRVFSCPLCRVRFNEPVSMFLGESDANFDI